MRDTCRRHAHGTRRAIAPWKIHHLSKQCIMRFFYISDILVRVSPNHIIEKPFDLTSGYPGIKHYLHFLRPMDHKILFMFRCSHECPLVFVILTIPSTSSILASGSFCNFHVHSVLVPWPYPKNSVPVSSYQNTAFPFKCHI